MAYTTSPPNPRLSDSDNRKRYSDEILDQPIESRPKYDDYDEGAELRAVKMPIVYSFASEAVQRKMGIKRIRETVQHLMTTEQFDITDMHIRDSQRKNVVVSLSISVIAPNSQLLPLQQKSPTDNNNPLLEKRLIYEVLDGKGKISINDFTQPIYKSDIFTMEEGVRHNIINSSETDTMTIRCIYDGELDLRDRYMEKQVLREKAKESRRAVFNVSTQRVEEKEVTTVPQQQQQQSSSQSPTIVDPRQHHHHLKRMKIKPVRETKEDLMENEYEAIPESENKFT